MIANTSIAEMIAAQTAPTITSRTITLTPEIAAKFLESLDGRDDIDISQRTLNSRTVDNYVRQMNAGNWIFNGEALIISDKGYLMDGQHRCRAVIKSNQSIQVVVTYGVDESAMDTINQGRNRSHADVLNMAGYSKPMSQIMATAGRMELRMRVNGLPNNNSGVSETPKDVRTLVESDPDLIKSAEWANSFSRRQMPYPRSDLAWLHYRFMKHDPIFSEGWLDSLITGANLGAGDPRLWIRSKIAREMTSKSKTRENYRMAWVIKAWDRGRKGKKLKSEPNFFSNMDHRNEIYRLLLPADNSSKS